jgi:hypothetical protein
MMFEITLLPLIYLAQTVFLLTCQHSRYHPVPDNYDGEPHCAAAGPPAAYHTRSISKRTYAPEVVASQPAGQEPSIKLEYD